MQDGFSSEDNSGTREEAIVKQLTSLIHQRTELETKRNEIIQEISEKNSQEHFQATLVALKDLVESLDDDDSLDSSASMTRTASNSSIVSLGSTASYVKQTTR